MEWNIRTLLLLLVMLGIGYGIGLLEARLRRPKQTPGGKAAPAKGIPAEGGGPPGEAKGEQELLHIVMEPSGNLRFRLEGTPLESPETVTSDQRSLLIQLLLQIRPWVEGSKPAPAKPAPKEGAASSSSTAPSPAAEAEAAPSPVEPRSIVSQIDDLLQKRLAGTPLAAKGIRLQESPDEGVIFWVGLQRYTSVEAIPDAEAVTAIRAAIAEWEGKV